MCLSLIFTFTLILNRLYYHIISNPIYQHGILTGTQAVCMTTKKKWDYLLKKKKHQATMDMAVKADSDSNEIHHLKGLSVQLSLHSFL